MSSDTLDQSDGQSDAENPENAQEKEAVSYVAPGQSLTEDEVKSAVRSGGVRGAIQALTKGSSRFEVMTDTQKAKYVERKVKRHIVEFQILRPTSQVLCAMFYEKSAGKVLGMRPDTLALLAGVTNVRPGARVIVADTVQGLALAAVVERLAGRGEVLFAYAGQCPASPSLELMFGADADTRGRVFSLDLPALLSDMMAPPADARFTGPEVSLVELSKGFAKPLANFGWLRGAEHFAAAKEWLHGGVDAVVIATHLDQTVIAHRLFAFLKLCGTLTVYSQDAQSLGEILVPLKMPAAKAANFQLVELFTRHHQVLSNRTHPHVNMNMASGFVLSCIRISEFNTPLEKSSGAGRKAKPGAGSKAAKRKAANLAKTQGKKQKVEGEEDGEEGEEGEEGEKGEEGGGDGDGDE